MSTATNDRTTTFWSEDDDTDDVAGDDLAATDDTDDTDDVATDDSAVLTDAGDGIDGDRIVLFPGDSGELTKDQRTCLHLLVKRRFITAARQPAEWATLLHSEKLLRSRLHELFLQLHLDRDREVAYKSQAVPETGTAFPTLLIDTAWTREDTILLLLLRTRLRQDGANGETAAIIGIDDMTEHLEQYRALDTTNVAAAQARAAKSIEHIRRQGLLRKTADPERFIIEPVIEALLPLDKLTALLASLREALLAHDADSPTIDHEGDGADPNLDLPTTSTHPDGTTTDPDAPGTTTPTKDLR